MRTAALFLSFVAFSSAANAQRFNLLPQVGFENSKTVIGYNDLSSFSPLGVKFSPQASLRLNYLSKQGHGFFIGAATSRSIVTVTVTDPESGLNSYQASAGNMQVRLEGGYQFSTAPIYFNKNKAKESSVTRSTTQQDSWSGNPCRKNYTVSSRCGSKPVTNTPITKSKDTWFRVQPSIGMGFIPAVKDDVKNITEASPPAYEYRAGNWNTALITGISFEFGTNKTSLFTIGINYFNAMGNLGKQTISTIQSGKTTTTILQSDVSGWNLRIGVPFALGVKKTSIKNKPEAKVEPVRKTGCGQYRVSRSVKF